ncbi:MAG: CDP-diacylglycerol--glycerol-3-phosphate 3-phosphatidyltransferase [Candidatus Omnitrophica bacterium]|nr:CDP-diacylglycerol--glycerol-3-phosphate 3-phosphatidyltransferase [Candidatus Omnitrophota bacterium]
MIHPNYLTLFRIGLAILFCSLLPFATQWVSYMISFLVLVTAVITDWYDGKIARRFNLETNLGKMLDPIADKILVLGAFSVMSYLEVYPIIWIVPIAIREILVTGVRIVRMRYGQILASEKVGKLKAVVQYATILTAYIVLILRELTDFSLTLKTFHFFLVMVLCITNLVTIYSGALFFQGLKAKTR